MKVIKGFLNKVTKMPYHIVCKNLMWKIPKLQGKQYEGKKGLGKAGFGNGGGGERRRNHRNK